MDEERIKTLMELVKKEFPDWKNCEEDVKEAIQSIGDGFLDKFGSLGWQEQDMVIDVLQAIRSS